MPALYIQRGWLGLAAPLLFLAHASFYLYFFVDDEGITLVYARSLLEGRGFTYADFEGPTEGYSNFLHVIVMAGVLGLVLLAGLDPIWAFGAGSLLSLACGAALVALVWRIGERLGLSLLARGTATLLLAASGPLAVWSSSSLETVPFALAFTILVATTLPEIRPRAAAVAAIAVALLRIDGLLFVAIWMAMRSAAGDAAARRMVIRRIAPVVLVTAVVYALARAWYFDSWLPLPLQAKVADKLTATTASVVWTDRGKYLLGFAQRAGWPFLIGLAAAAVAATRGQRPVWMIGGAAVALGAYAAIVGDWMFGFRFFVPLLAPLALLCGCGVSFLESRRRWFAVAAAAILTASAAVCAARFHAFYQSNQQKPSFWAVRALDPALKFGEYYEAYRALSPLAPPGTRIAYHEAGFVPFLLDAENIDMLGLTSRFIGSAPTADAILTDVGRYYPLTPEPPHHAVHAFLVLHRPELLVARRRWTMNANAGRIPAALLDGYYRLHAETESFVIYKRTEKPLEPEQSGVDGFLENLAHPAYARRLALNDVPLAPADTTVSLPFMWQGGGAEVIADPVWRLSIDSKEAALAHQVFLQGTAPSGDLLVEVDLKPQSAGPSTRLQFTAVKGRPIRLQQTLDAPQDTAAIEIRLTSRTGQAVRLVLVAVRVMGQSDELRDHVERHGMP